MTTRQIYRYNNLCMCVYRICSWENVKIKIMVMIFVGNIVFTRRVAFTHALHNVTQKVWGREVCSPGRKQGGTWISDLNPVLVLPSMGESY